ncbi:oligopeptidase A [Thalassotalea sp. HSM 43]|uniref:oligopeptidase A n=1 Tax=Thalassotalea sp. HSM 43 TaxID=2552945 RepID=UPI001081D177|nr:oligopeptidase A [Thalassotalea sp. HSM 43]QBY04465.1 oligopeptidase A [Thalassotalea sp. HSM 43]
MTNPLLEQAQQQGALPLFSQIKPEHIKPAVEKAINDAKQAIESIAAKGQDYSWQNLVAYLDDVDDILEKIWSPVSHMNSVVNSDELRDAYDSCLATLSEYSTWVGQHEGLYNAYKSLSESNEFNRLDVAQKKVISNALRDFKLSGIGLEQDKKQRYGEIQTRLSELASKFSNNLLDATGAFSVLIDDESELAGLPDSALAGAKQMAESQQKQGWLFTLDIPSYLPVMMYCDNAELREKLYVAYVTRASDQGPNAGEFDNTDIMAETLSLRHELAQLLGFDSYAEESLATKMAENSDQVMTFLQDLAQKSKSQGENDLSELRTFAQQEFAKTDLQPWDLAYYSEKLKQSRYAISDEDLRPYFPEDKVIAGLFEVVHRLYGVSIKQLDGIDSWHQDVSFYQVFDRDDNLRGSFYLDLYARDKKRGGAWMADCVGRRQLNDDSVQLPVAFLTCNFTKPVGDKPALFTHDEVVTLFHEFGHGLHHMLTQVNASGVAGINGVAWDAVELPSQFLENWCWEPQALAFLSSHHETGEPLPQAMLDKMLAAKNFQSAMQMLRQLEFSIFDFTIHAQFDPSKGDQIQSVLNQVRDKYAVVKAPEFNRFQHSFGHIFAGGYAAGYYSYKWAEVLSADAYARFEEEGIFNADTGKDFLECVLEKGGSEEPMELFKAFRGREPQVDALLRHSGIGV